MGVPLLGFLVVGNRLGRLDGLAVTGCMDGETVDGLDEGLKVGSLDGLSVGLPLTGDCVGI